MRTPANPTKKFMNDLIGSLNQFFEKVSKQQIKIQVPEIYAFSKKSQAALKAKTIHKEAKQKNDLSDQKAKLLKKAFKNFKNQMQQNQQLLNKLKSEKAVIKHAKNIWKNILQSQKIKWASYDKKKKQAIANKLKAKNTAKSKQDQNQ